MNKKKLLDTLKNLGLTDNESQVYFAALGMGPTSVQEISSQSGVKRTSVYSIIRDLQSMGLMSI